MRLVHCAAQLYRLSGTLLAVAVAGCALSEVRAAPEVLTPYVTDGSTLHLWHLDERKPPFADQVKNGTNLMGLLNNAEAGVPSIDGLDSSIRFDHDAGGRRGSSNLKGAILLAAPELADGDADNVPAGFRFAGADGAFTLEAVVHFDVLPAAANAVAMSIISMDGEGKDRTFNFRVESSGFLSFTPLSVGGGGLAAIPTTGPHAVNTTDWFHLAVAYDGKEGTANNLKLYWTRLDGTQTSAHLIGRGTLAADFGTQLGDFAIGNEARQLSNNAEAEPFRGLIDEVRISSVARDPSDFLFVDPKLRKHSGVPDDPSMADRPLELELSRVSVDYNAVALPVDGKTLSLTPGIHRLSFDFGIPPDKLRDPVKLRSRLKGLDESWNESGRGMIMTCEVVDGMGATVSLVQLPVVGASHSWQTSIEDSGLTARSEPIQVPASGKSVRITLSSGADDTTGVFVIDGLHLTMRSAGKDSVSIWSNSEFDKGIDSGRPGDQPNGWIRSGSDPTIARIVKTSIRPSLALVDGDQAASGVWRTTRPLPRIPADGATMLLKWNEMFNVIGGSLHRATFVSVPPGEYTFEAIAASSEDTRVGSHISLPFTIRSPIWSRPWLWALVATCIVGSLALGILAMLRQKAARKVHGLRLQNALAHDRARIARDMHDDLGTRITRLTMNVALVQRDMEKKPTEARRHLASLSSSARELVTAMDGLVWAVDPANDTLDQLGERLAMLAEEVFQDSEVRYTNDIPHVLPDWPLQAEMRHHLFLAVNEGLHNVLQHAGPCEATLSLMVGVERLTVTIADTGRGFDTHLPSPGNGLNNLVHRLESVGGSFTIKSAVGKGTRVVMDCPLAIILRNRQKHP